MLRCVSILRKFKFPHTYHEAEEAVNFQSALRKNRKTFLLAFQLHNPGTFRRVCERLLTAGGKKFTLLLELVPSCGRVFGRMSSTDAIFS